MLTCCAIWCSALSLAGCLVSPQASARSLLPLSGVPGLVLGVQLSDLGLSGWPGLAVVRAWPKHHAVGVVLCQMRPGQGTCGGCRGLRGVSEASSQASAAPRAVPAVRPARRQACCVLLSFSEDCHLHSLVITKNLPEMSSYRFSDMRR